MLGVHRNRRVKYLQEVGATLEVLSLKSSSHRTGGAQTVARKTSLPPPACLNLNMEWLHDGWNEVVSMTQSFQYFFMSAKFTEKTSPSPIICKHASSFFAYHWKNLLVSSESAPLMTLPCSSSLWYACPQTLHTELRCEGLRFKPYLFCPLLFCALRYSMSLVSLIVCICIYWWMFLSSHIFPLFTESASNKEGSFNKEHSS